MNSRRFREFFPYFTKLDEESFSSSSRVVLFLRGEFVPEWRMKIGTLLLLQAEPLQRGKGSLIPKMIKFHF